MSLRVGLERIFEDPISQEIMQSPIVITRCGHTFQDATIRQWIGELPSRACPTCDRPIAKADLVRNYVAEDAVGILKAPENSLAKRVQHLGVEEHQKQREINSVKKVMKVVFQEIRSQEPEGFEGFVPFCLAVMAAGAIGNLFR